MLIVHGTADPTVKLELSNEFVAILKQRRLRHEYVVVEGGVHSFALQPPQMDLRPVVRNFLTQVFSVEGEEHSR